MELSSESQNRKKERNPAYLNRKKRKPRDSDYMFALMLQRQEARRSSRKRTATSKMDDYEYYSPIKNIHREVENKNTLSDPTPPEKKKLESLLIEDRKGETRTANKGHSEPIKLNEKIGLAGKKRNDGEKKKS